MRTRTLLPSPPTSRRVDGTGGLAFGSYEGPLPPVELSSRGLRSAARSLARRKKWVWLAVTTDEVWLSLAVVRMGYAATAFAYVFDLRSGRMLVDRTLVAPPFAASVPDDPHAKAPSALARFSFAPARARIAIDRGVAPGALALRVRLPGLEVDGTLDEAHAPPAISAIARLSPGTGLASATEKRALTGVRGSLTAGGRRFALDGGLGGYDYTHGLMPRRTRWRWAFAMGRSRAGAGEPIAFNVVEGFVGEAECAAFTRGGEGIAPAVVPIAEPRFDFDAGRPTAPWRVVGPDMDLTFDVGAVHEQRTNLGVARSRFVQPVGTFRGRLSLAGREVVVDGLPGVVEDQDVLW